MMDYGAAQTGQNDFAAMPRVVQSKYRFKDPYGNQIEEYYPSNIMHDKRIQRGNTYAAMVIPAGTNPDTMAMERKQDDFKKRSFKATTKQSPRRVRAIYPNRDIPTPEPVPGREHRDMQTEKYVEQLTDKPPTQEVGIATEFYLDRPPVPLFQPKMPAKNNCKATQIYDGDHELFDFNEEVEPMLNVLCEKSLEQARMEVLEEEELRIIKDQQKEYEEIRNAELIEAQRFEATENRVKDEVARRGVQQRARKREREAAHQKHVCRVMAKKHMSNIRFDVLRTLADMGMMMKPLERDLEEDVLPWMIEQMEHFLIEDTDANQTTEVVIDTGVHRQKVNHGRTLAEKKEADQQAQLDKMRADKANEQRKKDRRAAREKRAKDQEKQRLRDEIRKIVIDRGDVKTPVAQWDLLDVHGNYERGKHFFGGLGGHLQQLYLVCQAVRDVFGTEDNGNYFKRLQADPTDETLKKAQNPSELFMDRFFYPFMLQFLRDAKVESFQLMSTPKMQALLESFKLPIVPSHGNYDLSKMTLDQYAKFRYEFVESRLGNEVYSWNKGRKAIEKILNVFCLILCKRIPPEIMPVKGDLLYNKIKLLPVPKGIELEDRQVMEKVPATDSSPETERSVVIPRNTAEKAVVRVLIPKKRLTRSEMQEQTDEGVMSDGGNSERLVEMDEDDRGLAICARLASMPYGLYVIHQYAQRVHRNEYITAITKAIPEFFQDNSRQRDIQEAAEHLCDQMEESWIAQHCGEYELPLLEFNVHAPDFE